MSGLAAAGKAASSLTGGVAAGLRDNCGSGTEFWATALEMGTAAEDGFVSGIACTMVLELAVGDCCGAGVALCAGTGCDDVEVCGAG